MEKIDDETLLEALKKKLEENRIAVTNLRAMTQNLEAVNEKLRQSESLKTDFLSNIRNEINNPLASIMGLTKQVVDRKADADRTREIAGMIYHEAFDLDFQLRNIFAAAELEAGETTPSVALVDVAALVRNQLAAFGHKRQRKKFPSTFSASARTVTGSRSRRTRSGSRRSYPTSLPMLLSSAMKGRA